MLSFGVSVAQSNRIYVYRTTTPRLVLRRSAFRVPHGTTNTDMGKNSWKSSQTANDNDDNFGEDDDGASHYGVEILKPSVCACVCACV